MHGITAIIRFLHIVVTVRQTPEFSLTPNDEKCFELFPVQTLKAGDIPQNLKCPVNR